LRAILDSVMAHIRCRLLPYAVADGPHQMAADEVLLDTAATGIASLRFYGWSPATLSLGYFQAERLRHTNRELERLPFVRRPTGGATLVHDHEVTYGLGLPAGPAWQAGEPWLRRMHAIIASALGKLDVPARMISPDRKDVAAGVLCFQQFTAGDILLNSAKIVGSAQRRQRGALLQHGAILLAKSSHAPVLPGIQELSKKTLTIAEVVAAVSCEFAQQTGWELVAEDWGADERRRIEELVGDKYGRDRWNCKR